MTRANRCFAPGYVWHLTHRCHQKNFLLRFQCDRQAWVRWLYVARKRFGLCVLNYQVTSNHVHLLVRDRGHGEIARSMQLVEGRTGQSYNRRKNRCGAFWEDRYHATAVGSGPHLLRCLVYIDLNMVRAGVVAHPKQWLEAGYQEILSPPDRYRIVDRGALAEALGLERLADLKTVYFEQVELALQHGQSRRVSQWSEAEAVGDPAFVEQFRRATRPTKAVLSTAPAGEVGLPARTGSLVRESRLAYWLKPFGSGLPRLGVS